NYSILIPESSTNPKTTKTYTTIDKFIYINTAYIKLGTNEQVILAIGDVSEYQRVEGALHTTLKLNSIIDTLPIKGILQHSLDEAEKLTHSDAGFFHLINKTETAIITKTWSTNTEKSCPMANSATKTYVINERGLLKDCLLSRLPIIQNDYASLPNQKTFPKGHIPITREVVVPIFSGKNIVAIIGVGNKPTDYDQYDIDALNLLAKNAWLYVERKLLENQTIESNTRYMELTSKIPIGVYRYKSAPDGTIIWDYISSRFSKMLDISFSDALENPYFIDDLVHPDDIGNYEIAYVKSHTKPQSFIWEGRLIVRDTLLWVHIETIPTITKSGVIIWDGIINDISKQKLLESELNEAIYSAKLAVESKSNFLANMSHEIRTPMNAIIGFNALLNRTELSNIQANYLQKSNSAAENLLHIINDILDFSKIEAGKLILETIPFNLNDIIEYLSTMFSDKAFSKGLEYIINIKKEIPVNIIGDPLRLTQILTNLISNSIKFTEYGQVILKTSHSKQTKSAVTLTFEISDTGIGMTGGEIKKLFKSFSQADESTTRRFGGTGLGLNISKNLADLMDGRLTLKSKKSVGTTFTFTCTFKLGTPTTKSVEFIPEGLTYKVMVVDDNDTVREVINAYLNSFNIYPTLVSSGEEAVAKIDSSYNLIILDWKLTGLDGIEAWRIIKGNLGMSAPKPIMLTAYSRNNLTKAAHAAGINHILMKPITHSVLFDLVSHLLEYEDEPLSKNTTMELLQNMDILKNKLILLVEDNEINQQVAKELLECQGIIVDIASNGIEGIEMSRNTPYDLILMDLQMPLLDGYNAAIKIKLCDQNPSPIIALTADVMTDTKTKVLDSGMLDYIAKPFNANELYKKLITIFERG
ncbi:MAG: response regulator, partial [Vallitaleaceae bacterium]|nr:response regulator [Vallitaleaceae bacterium]